MNKRIWSMVSLILLLSYVGAEPVQSPQMGQGIDILFQALENNTLAQERNTKIIQDTYGKIDEAMTQYMPRITFGVSVFMLIMYLTILFFDKLRLIRKKKTYEERIKELEQTQKEVIEETNKVIHDLNSRLTPLMSVLEIMEGKPIKSKSNKKMFWYGFIAMGILIIILNSIKGWI